jgi:phosphatidylinositol kinase/protein kinase (PI-3  family)
MCLPLGDRGGVVEWVLNTRTYNSILQDTYSSMNIPLHHINPGLSKPAWDAAYKKVHSKPPTDTKALIHWMDDKCAAVPPVMHDWWLTTCATPSFHTLTYLPCLCDAPLDKLVLEPTLGLTPPCCRKADPSTWLQARTTFTRSTAAWSLAGHVVGLGDRHCDNLLVDLVTGANVQIDFGHLFDSGRELPIPEIVPFRLTQNITDSFGVCGVEGPFRNSCCAGARFLAPSCLFVCLFQFSRVQ